MTREEKYSHTIFFDTREEKEQFQRWLWHLKYKTGENHGRTANRALMEYNVKITGGENHTPIC